MNGCRAAPELNTPWTGDAQFSWRVGKTGLNDYLQIR
jgi:hypothetical protein